MYLNNLKTVEKGSRDFKMADYIVPTKKKKKKKLLTGHYNGSFTAKTVASVEHGVELNIKNSGLMQSKVYHSVPSL